MIVFVGTTIKKAMINRHKIPTMKNKFGLAFFSGIGFISIADTSGDNCGLCGEFFSLK